MRYGSKSSVRLIAALAVLSMLSACAHNEERPKLASDFCLNDRPLSVNVAPGPGVDDPGNELDSDQTVLAVFSHNAVFHSLCPAP